MPVNPDLFNKIIKTLCQGQSPRGTRGNGQIKVAFLLEECSSKMDPTQIKKRLYHFVFYCPPTQHIFPELMVPIFAELNNHYSVLEMTVQAIVVQRLSENWV